VADILAVLGVRKEGAEGPEPPVGGEGGAVSVKSANKVSLLRVSRKEGGTR